SLRALLLRTTILPYTTLFRSLTWCAVAIAPHQQLPTNSHEYLPHWLSPHGSRHLSVGRPPRALGHAPQSLHQLARQLIAPALASGFPPLPLVQARLLLQPAYE